MTNDAEFMKQRQDAITRMLNQSRQSALPTPPFVQTEFSKPPEKTAAAKPQNLLPFLSDLTDAPDRFLLVGLLLLLWNDQADRRLMLALLYILL